MEAFAVALFGAVASAAVSKLVTVIDKLPSRAPGKADAGFIKDELVLIDSLIKLSFSDKGLSGHVSILQAPCIGILRCLAYDIEDCIDSFEANKTSPEDFANKIRNIKDRSIETKGQIESYLKQAESLVGRTHQGAGIGTAQGAAIVPRELQDLLDDPTRQAWLGENLNCLLYFCLFPPNHDVSTKPLMRRWMAEGLVQGEDVAAENLEILITASIISASNNGDMVEMCQPNPEMHACISQKSKSQNFVLVCDGNISNQKLPDDARRLSIVHPHASLPLKLHSLRTLAVFPAAAATAGAGGAPSTLASYEAVLDFSRYGVLRVLDLKECAHLGEKHLDDILGKDRQVLLKYLSMNMGSIGRIERKIGCLSQLETLDLSGTKTVTVFKEVLLLPKLKHLLGKFQLSSIDKLSVPVLGWFESGLEKFLSEKSLLEKLEGFVTGETLGFPQLMSLMRRLREVKIWCKSNASKRNLKHLSEAITEFIRKTTREPHVHRSMSIHFEGSSGKFTNNIVPVAGKLDSLNLRGNLSKFPQFAAELSAIEELHLWSTGLRWGVILAGLSNVKGLKYLKVVEDNLGRIEIQPAHIKSIQRICIVSVPMLDMTIQTAALPHLVSLHMLCQDLHVTPGTPGVEIAHMKNLKEVTLHHQVAGGIRAEWQKAVDGHSNRPLPVLLPLQGQ